MPLFHVRVERNCTASQVRVAAVGMAVLADAPVSLLSHCLGNKEPGVFPLLPNATWMWGAGHPRVEFGKG